jgi:FlaA1/EpsC-like NDP-sugar epimerase
MPDERSSAFSRAAESTTTSREPGPLRGLTVGLVLSAASMATSGETFVLDMGEPVRIVDLVRRYAKQLGAPDVQINFTGLRPGERLHERLFSKKEERVPTANPGIWATRPQPLPDDFATCLSRLYATAARGDDDLVRTMLGDVLPDYTPVIDDSGLALASPYADEF